MGKSALFLVALAFAACGGSDVLSPLPSPVNPDEVMISGLTIVDGKSEVMLMGAPGAVKDATKVLVTNTATKVAQELTVAKGGSFGSTFEASGLDTFEIVALSAGGAKSEAISVKAPPATLGSSGAGPLHDAEGPSPFTLTDLGEGRARLAGTISLGYYVAVSNLTTGAAWASEANDQGRVDLTIDAVPCDQIGVFDIDPANRGMAGAMWLLSGACPE